MKHLILPALLFLTVIAEGQMKIDTTKFKLSDTSVTSSLIASPGFAFNSFPKMYIVDWTKIKTFADLKNVMEATYIYISADFKNFSKLKKYLIESK